MRRQVSINIEESPTGHLFYVVRFDRRSKWQKHWAAQFDARHSTKAEVVEWVKSKPNYILKEEDNGSA